MEKYNGKSPRIIYIYISFKKTYLPSPIYDDKRYNNNQLISQRCSIINI